MKTYETLVYHLAPLFGLHLNRKYGVCKDYYLSENKDALLKKTAAVALGLIGGGALASFRSYKVSAIVATSIGALSAIHPIAYSTDFDKPISPGFFRIFALAQLITTTKLANRPLGGVLPAITPFIAIYASYRRHISLARSTSL